jgi:Protein of unknown function (DUF3667)
MDAIEPAAPRDVAVPEAAAVVPAHCKNCDAVLLGRFCANCSQAANVHVPTTRELVHEMLEGLTHSDSRLWRTLTTLWFKPGKLTQEFVAGRRVAYLPPFRLYLILSIVFFLIASFIHMNVPVMQFDEAMKPGSPPASASKLPANRITSCSDINFMTFTDHPTWKPRIAHICEAVLRDNGENLLHAAIGTASKAMFIFLPLIAFLNMLMYWHPRYRYAEQLLFFVHLHAFYFSVAILLILIIEAASSWPKLEGVAGILETVLGWSLPVYTGLAMRRVFRRSWLGTLFKGVVLFFVYMIVFALTVGGVFVYAALQL